MRLFKKTILFGHVVNKYKIPAYAIKDLNRAYEKAKKHLESYAHKLAGRLESELSIVPILEKTKIMSHIVDCINDYVKSSIKYGQLEDLPYHANITATWINDMVAGEYNPPHSHQNNMGYSVVLFLKIPKFINDVNSPHKFKDGTLGFLDIPRKGVCYLEPKVGDFYIFQAEHQHCVMPFKTKGKNDIRRSMSFNFLLEPPSDSPDPNQSRKK